MISSFFYIEIFLGVVVLGLALRGFYSWSKVQEIQMQREKYTAMIEYDRSLNECVLHPENKELYLTCLEKGDLFFKFNIPDYFNYPIPDHDAHVEFIDNRTLREEMVKKDLEERKNSFNISHIKGASIKGHRKLAA